MVVGPREVRCYGINKIGLERHGFSPERIKTLEQAYRLLLRSKLNTSQAVEKMRGTLVSLRGRPSTYTVHRVGCRSRLDEIGAGMAATAENTLGGWGLIAGNGDFPFLVLEGARSRGIEMTVIAIREEASPALERAAKRFHWISLGELSRGNRTNASRGSKARRDGRAGETQQDFQLDPSGLASRETIVFASGEKHGLADRSGRPRASGRRHRAGGFDEVSRAAAAGRGSPHAACAGRSGSGGHRIRQADRRGRSPASISGRPS